MAWTHPGHSRSVRNLAHRISALVNLNSVVGRVRLKVLFEMLQLPKWRRCIPDLNKVVYCVILFLQNAAPSSIPRSASLDARRGLPEPASAHVAGGPALKFIW